MHVSLNPLKPAVLLFVVVCGTPLSAASPLEDALKQPILEAGTTQRETIRLAAPKIPKMPECRAVAEWEQHADRIRADVLNNVLLRGVPEDWLAGPVNVEMLDNIPGGPGYKMQKLRYEALPGFWIPAVLYIPEKLEGKAPVFMNVNGHDGKGKQAPYKQIRCINQAKRGIIALNVEWLRMGQLNQQDNGHGRLNQLDLCGISGLAPFYLSMKLGLDVLLSLENADPTRVGVAGLSGGGWQTSFISSLDQRVTLSNPVAGYSSLTTRLNVFQDLGDSEQTPVDFALYADYTHLTALLAPRHALLTYNAQDNCCFVSATALPPLLAAAEPVYKLYGVPQNLTSHVNADPGTHNFLQENREALYARIGKAFFPNDANYSDEDINCGDDIKSFEELLVPLPEANGTLHSLAVTAMQDLPRDATIPQDHADLAAWRTERREVLRDLVRSRDYTLDGTAAPTQQQGETRIVRWTLRCDDVWTVPVVELSRGTPQETVILFSADGKGSLAEAAEAALLQGQRVLAVDLWYCGECRPVEREYLFALMLQTVGERPLGVQASQLAALARWSRNAFRNTTVTLQSQSGRTTLAALSAAALEPDAIRSVVLCDGTTSLKQVITDNVSFEKAPEQFTFGLLKEFDIPQIEALIPSGAVTRQ
ncbi:MAG: alpha/beta hydrolase family protein [Planctomycetaceae bacterium]